MQLGLMSKRELAKYEAKRRGQWEASAACKAAFRAAVVAAYRAGSFEREAASDDAQRAVQDAQRAETQAARDARWAEAKAWNQLTVAECSKGARVFALIGGHYGEVVRVSKQSIRIKPEAKYLQGKTMLVHAGCIQRMSYNDLEEMFRADEKAR